MASSRSDDERRAVAVDSLLSFFGRELSPEATQVILHELRAFPARLVGEAVKRLLRHSDRLGNPLRAIRREIDELRYSEHPAAAPPDEVKRIDSDDERVPWGEMRRRLGLPRGATPWAWFAGEAKPEVAPQRFSNGSYQPSHERQLDNDVEEEGR